MGLTACQSSRADRDYADAVLGERGGHLKDNMIAVA
jgi:hypothetical protein